MNNSITQYVAHLLLFSLAMGTQLYSPIVSTKLTGPGFYRLGAGIVLGSLLCSMGLDYFMAPAMNASEYLCYLFLIASNIFTYAFHQDEKTPLMWGLYALQLVAFSALAYFSFGATLALVMFISTMLFFGISNFAMILGHYYLVVPKLSERPLIVCLYFYWATLLIKIILSVIGVNKAIALGFFDEGTVAGDGYLFNWIFFIMRYLWGGAAPLILSYFTYRLCRMRSIQSATGVLYIMEFFVIVGEMIAAYLFFKFGFVL